MIILAVVLVAGCVIEPVPTPPASTNCTGEGGSIPVIANPPSCCTGLSLIPPRQEHILGSEGICTAKCGNGVCDSESETAYNCPTDCTNNSTAAPAGGGGSGMANPASVNCEEKGGTLRIVTQEDGGQIGICTLADGVTECEEWAYFRGECGNVSVINSDGSNNSKLSASVRGCAASYEERVMNESVGVGFCGTSTFGSCTSDSECVNDGCSGEVCRGFQEESRNTACIWRDCYDPNKYDATCACVEGKCQWATVTGETNKGWVGFGTERSASIEVVNNTITYSRALNHLCCRDVMIMKETDTPPMINIYEVWSGIGCKCICFSEISAAITDVPAGTYIVSVYASGTEPGGEEPMVPSLILSANVTISNGV